jgi:hypothetical protein
MRVMKAGSGKATETTEQDVASFEGNREEQWVDYGDCKRNCCQQ